MTSCSPGDPGKLWESVEAEGVKRLPGHSRAQASMRLTLTQSPCPGSPGEGSGSQIGLPLGAWGGLRPGPVHPSTLTPPNTLSHSASPLAHAASCPQPFNSPRRRAKSAPALAA